MKRFFGGVLGAVAGVILFSVVWFFVSSDAFAFKIGLAVAALLGGIVGGGLGAWCADRTEWSQQKVKLMRGSVAAFAAPPGIVTLSWLMVASMREGYWHTGRSGALGSMLFCSALLTLVGSGFGGMVGAVVGAAACLFVKPPVLNAIRSAPAEGVWPPPPTAAPVEDK